MYITNNDTKWGAGIQTDGNTATCSMFLGKMTNLFAKRGDIKICFAQRMEETNTKILQNQIFSFFSLDQT